jgi:hypothetical protein
VTCGQIPNCEGIEAEMTNRKGEGDAHGSHAQVNYHVDGRVPRVNHQYLASVPSGRRFDSEQPSPAHDGNRINRDGMGCFAKYQTPVDLLPLARLHVAGDSILICASISHATMQLPSLSRAFMRMLRGGEEGVTPKPVWHAG